MLVCNASCKGVLQLTLHPTYSSIHLLAGERLLLPQMFLHPMGRHLLPDCSNSNKINKTVPLMGEMMTSVMNSCRLLIVS